MFKPLALRILDPQLSARTDLIRQFLDEQRAAALFYEVQGRRVTVVVFPSPDGVPAGAPVRLGNNDLFYGSVRGYAVPVRQHDGLSYAFTGDMDRDSLMRLAASARVSP